MVDSNFFAYRCKLLYSRSSSISSSSISSSSSVSYNSSSSVNSSSVLLFGLVSTASCEHSSNSNDNE
jgi:hypothetical protein